MTRPDIVGRNQLPLCKNRFYMNIKFPDTRWLGNAQHNMDKRKQEKKRQLDTLFASKKRDSIKTKLNCILGYI